MHRLPVAALAALLTSPVAAQPPIPPAVTGSAKIDGPLKVAPYRQVRLSITADPNETVSWRVRPGKAADFANGADAPTLVFVAPPGRYTVEVFVVGVNKEGRPTLRIDETEVEIGDAPPPNPDPPKPPPVNPYRVALKAAFDADPGEATAKADVRTKLAELYSLGATMAADPAVTTTDVLRERLRRAGSTLAGDQLVGTRTAIANLLAPVLPLGQPLDVDRRQRAAELFRGISEALAW